LAAVDADTQRAALVGLPDARELRRRFEAAWERRELALAGAPYLAKDLYRRRGHALGAGTTFLAAERGPDTSDASLLSAFRDDAGAVPVGGTQLNELAFGLSGENPHFGDCPHPADRSRLSGGSSSGSAWAVGAGLVPFALATDTVGSIRVPATWCGAFGLRLPAGLGAEDVFPLSPGFDALGWIAGTAEDLRLTSEAVLGPADTALGPGLWLGDPGAGIDDRALALFRSAAEALGAEPAAEAAELRRSLEGAGEAYPVLGGAAAARAHAGLLARHADALDPSVRARLEAGARRTPAELGAASAVRARVTDALGACLDAGWDWVALPCTAGPALPRGGHVDAERRRLLILNAPASLAGLPAIAVPVALPGGGTGGVQLVCRDAAGLRSLAARVAGRA
jgi:amidase/aspartyl-tRNA(Asn)/glutamyl-tRNA(Gln) amidotransferase subunit A